MLLGREINTFDLRFYLQHHNIFWKIGSKITVSPSQCVQFQSAVSGRRKLEVDLQTLLQEHEELQAELRGSTDKAKKASCEVERDIQQKTCFACVTQLQFK